MANRSHHSHWESAYHVHCVEYYTPGFELILSFGRILEPPLNGGSIACQMVELMLVGLPVSLEARRCC